MQEWRKQAIGLLFQFLTARYYYYVIINKKLSYRRETARQLHTSFSAHSLIVHFTEHRICFTTI